MSGLDIFFIIFSLLSAILAMIRGFTREVFTLIAWLGAIFVPIYLILNYKPEISNFVGSGTVALIGFSGVVFVLVLMALTYVSIRLSNMLFDSKMSVLESSLGFVFGLARGLVVISILYIFFSSLVPEKDHPEWITKARSLTLIQGTGQSLISLFPEEPYEVITQFFDSILKPKNPSSLPTNTGQQRSTTQQTPLQSTAINEQNENAFRGGDRQSLNQLLETTR